MSHTIYKASAKGLASTKFTPKDRFILRDNCGLWFTNDGVIVQSDLRYNDGKPDSHLVATNEQVSDYKFTICKAELTHASRHHLWLPEITTII